MQSQVGTDVGVVAIHLRVGTLSQHIRGVDEIGVVGRFENVGSRMFVDDTETTSHLQLFIDEPLQIKVIGNGCITSIVESVQCGVV